MQLNHVLKSLADKQAQQYLKIGIQGQKGSFHHAAAQHYFLEQAFELVPYTSFYKLAKGLQDAEIDRAVMAFENTKTRCFDENYNLVLQGKVIITGEVVLRIHQNLMAFPGQSLKDIVEVHSHPIALKQCRSFLLANCPTAQLVNKADTAGSAKWIRKNMALGVAAIGSIQAAELYELDILARNIEQDNMNFTRFVILERKNLPLHPSEPVDKATISFKLKNKIGELADPLILLRDRGINLTNIQSTPIEGKPWIYNFFLDLEFQPEQYSYYRSSLDSLKNIVNDFTIIGEYKKTDFSSSM